MNLRNEVRHGKQCLTNQLYFLIAYCLREDSNVLLFKNKFIRLDLLKGLKKCAVATEPRINKAGWHKLVKLLMKLSAVKVKVNVIVFSSQK